MGGCGDIGRRPLLDPLSLSYMCTCWGPDLLDERPYIFLGGRTHNSHKPTHTSARLYSAVRRRESNNTIPYRSPHPPLLLLPSHHRPPLFIDKLAAWLNVTIQEPIRANPPTHPKKGNPKTPSTIKYNKIEACSKCVE
jgi:hypothetical protein